MTNLRLPGGKKVLIGAHHYSIPEPDDLPYMADQYSPGDLPSLVDLRPFLTPIENQGAVGSCTANALAGAFEYLEKRLTGAEGRVSRLFIYFNQREVEGDVAHDRGAKIRVGISVLKHKDTCCEETWPYVPASVLARPAPEAYHEARFHRIDQAHYIPVNLHAMRHCLAEGYPFVFGLQLFSSIRDSHPHGRIAMPDESRERRYGRHAMLCVGYSQPDGVFLVRNSWGTDWGDGGYCYIPYPYMVEPGYADSLWTIRRAHNLDFTRGITAAQGANGGCASLLRRRFGWVGWR